MKLKPSCLKGMENMFGITKVEKYIDAKDNLSLEDTSGRVKIDKANSKTRTLLRELHPSRLPHKPQRPIRPLV